MAFGRLPFAALLFACLQQACGVDPAPLNDRVSVSVRVNSEYDLQNLPNSVSHRIRVYKTLSIILKGQSKNPETRTVKWTIYGRNLMNNQVSPIDGRDLRVFFDEGKQTIDTSGTVTEYIPNHFEKGRDARRNIQDQHSLGIGIMYAGYSVQVFDGPTLVGEYSDPVGIGTKK